MWELIAYLQNGLAQSWQSLVLNWLFIACGLTLQGQTTQLSQQLTIKADQQLGIVTPWQTTAEVTTELSSPFDALPLAPQRATVVHWWRGEVEKGGVAFPFVGTIQYLDNEWFVFLQEQPPLGEYDFRAVVNKWWKMSQARVELDADQLLLMMEQAVRHADLVKLHVNWADDVVSVPFSLPANKIQALVPECVSDQPISGVLELSWQKWQWRRFQAEWRCQLQQTVAGVPAKTWLVLNTEGRFERTPALLQVELPLPQNSSEDSTNGASSSGSQLVDFFPNWDSLRAAPPAELPTPMPKKTLK